MPVPSPLRTAPRSRRIACATPLNLIAVCLLMLSSLGVAFGLPRQTDAIALGDGEYSLAAMVFGTSEDERVGNLTASGYRLQPFDRAVALPACTESSCPWLPAGTPKDGPSGAQTRCAEENGFCWVQITSEATGQCTVAPVVDLGPLFIRDNWWAPREERTYDLPRGIPAAEAAAEGADLGYGPGISDVGIDVAENYPQGAGIALAAGTWLDLGLDPERDITSVEVKLLWQEGIQHENACDGNYGNAETVETVNLRAGPSIETKVKDVIPAGRRITIIGPLVDGFYQVEVNGIRGWIERSFVQPDDNRVGGRVGFLIDDAIFRERPSSAGEIIQVIPRGSVVSIVGKRENGYFPVVYNEQEGWIESRFLEIGTTKPVVRDLAMTTANLNFRTGPGLEYAIFDVAPAGAVVELLGERENGYAFVLYDGAVGWMAEQYLRVAEISSTMTVLANLNLRAGPSTADRIITVLPAGAEVTITGEAQNGFVYVIYDGYEGWAYAEYLGTVRPKTRSSK